VGELTNNTSAAKEETSHHNKERHWERRHRSPDMLGQVVWAAILVFAGLIFLADNLGYLPGARDANPWQWIMFGAGGLLVIEALIRLVSVEFKGAAVGRLILGLILLGLGTSAVFGISLSAAWWPVILIVIGLSLLLRG